MEQRPYSLDSCLLNQLFVLLDVFEVSCSDWDKPTEIERPLQPLRAASHLLFRFGMFVIALVEVNFDPNFERWILFIRVGGAVAIFLFES